MGSFLDNTEPDDDKDMLPEEDVAIRTPVKTESAGTQNPVELKALKQRKIALQARLSTLLEEHNPEQWSPRWIYDTNVALSSAISRYANKASPFFWRTFVSEIDKGRWLKSFTVSGLRIDSIAVTLGSANPSPDTVRKEMHLYLQERTPVLQGRLRKCLDEFKPESVTPTWIEGQYPGLYQAICGLQKRTENFSWYAFMCGVGGGWELRLNLTCQNAHDCAGMLAVILRRDGIDQWNESLLMRRYPDFTKRAVNIIARSQNEGTPSFEALLPLTPQFVRNRYDPSYRDIQDEVAQQQELEQQELERQRKMEETEETREAKCFDELTQILLNDDEPNWTPLTVIDKNEGLSKRLSQRYSTPYGIRWSLILKKLPEPIAERFCMDRANYKLFDNYPEEKALFIKARRRYLQMQLRQELEKHNPESFSPKWIQDNNVSLYALIQAFKKLDIPFMWHVFIEGVGQTWIDRFSTSAPSLNEEELEPELAEKYEKEKALYLISRKKSLQRQLKSLLAKKSPDAFKPSWIEGQNASLYNAIRDLRAIDVDFTWYDFIEEMGDGWIDKFSHRQEDLDVGIKKLEEVIRLSGVETWDLEWVCKKYTTLADGIRGQLKKTYGSVSWSHVFEALPEDIMQRYNGREDDKGITTPRAENRIKQISAQITEAVSSRRKGSSVEPWTLEGLYKEHPEIWNAARRCRYNFDITFGLSLYLQYLPDEVLDALETNSTIMPYKILAERVRRQIDGKFLDGWKLSDLKGTKLKRDIDALGTHIEILLNYLPDKLRLGFIRDSRVQNRTQARIINVIERGNDDPQQIHKLLQRTGYLTTGCLSQGLIAGLQTEISRGNRYAATMAESIIDQALTSAGFSGVLPSVNIVELLMKTPSSGASDHSDIVMSLARRAGSRRGYSSKEVSLDTPFGRDGDGSFTRGHKIGAYS